jgi:uncharacterized RDD family membrane protein YckC
MNVNDLQINISQSNNAPSNDSQTNRARNYRSLPATGGDSSIGVQTPEGIEFALHPAGLPIRACAWAIDVAAQGVVIFIVILISEFMAIINQSISGGWFMLILIFALNWFYYTGFEIFWRGQSLGKRFMGIRVVRSDGSPVNPGASFLRNLLRFADSFMFLYLIAAVCMLASPAFRRIGDWVADTIVVYTAAARVPGRFTPPALRQSGMPWLANVPKITPSQKLGLEEKQAVLSFARRYPLLGKARADEIAALWTAKLNCSPQSLQASQKNNSAEEKNGGEKIKSDSAYLLGIAHTLGGSQ